MHNVYSEDDDSDASIPQDHKRKDFEIKNTLYDSFYENVAGGDLKKSYSFF